MKQSQPHILANDFSIQGNLSELTNRLAPGMRVSARIVEVLGDSVFVLRVWGYNMISESKYPFRRFDEVELEVKAVEPNLLFELYPLRNNSDGALYA